MRLAALCLVFVVSLGEACTVTLPFDELTGGIARGGPTPDHYYPFDEGTGTVIHDAVGTANGDAFTSEEAVPGFSVQWTKAGHKNSALRLAGGDTNVRIDGLSNGNYPKATTVAGWWKIGRNHGPFTGFFASDAEEDPVTKEDFGPFFVYVSDGGGSILFERKHLLDSHTIPLAIPKNLDNWVLVAFGWDIRSRDSFLYLREEGQKAQYASEKLDPDVAIPAQCGFLITAGTGFVDEVKVYSRLLGQDELNAIE